MRRVIALSAFGLPLFVLTSVGAAQAGPQVIAGVYASAEPAAPAARHDDLGGGFVEFLLTGKSDGRPVRRAASAAALYDPQDYAPQRSDAVAGAAPRADYAALGSSERPQQDIPAEFHRQEVDYQTHERPGTIVIDTPNRFLYLVEPDGRALRYGVGVGRPGFEWAGVKAVSRKAEWPGWTPPTAMMKRRPDLPAHMDGGEGNPLGARALYLGSSEYRIHGTNEPWSIGQRLSSGCIRMMNDDVIDLYERVKVGTRVIVM
jgi:lipoprotein-anchoring transpeptidase ErfK/SrfK